jgi:hypothetical protein
VEVEHGGGGEAVLRHRRCGRERREG